MSYLLFVVSYVHARHEMRPREKKQLLQRCAQTTLNSKLVSGYKGFFSKMVVDAVSMLDDDLDKEMIGIKKVTGGSVTVGHP